MIINEIAWKEPKDQKYVNENVRDMMTWVVGNKILEIENDVLEFLSVMSLAQY